MIRQFLTGTKTLLLNRPVSNGQILFPNDASEIYYDMNNVRRKVQGICYVQSNSDLSGIVNPEEKLYFSIGSRMLFAYDSSNNEFIQVNRTGVINNLTSTQRLALESCAEDCIYIDSDTMEAYIGVNLGSNSVSLSSFGNVFWRKIGESISNYNGLVDIKTNNKNVISTDNYGNISLGDNSNSININGDVRLDGSPINTPNGLLKLDNNGMIPSVFLQREKSDIVFTSDDLLNSKYIVMDSRICDFIVLDNDNRLVMPDRIQNGNNVEIDFSNFSVSGNWKISFTEYKVSNRKSETIHSSDLSNSKFTIGNCYIGTFSVLDAYGNEIIPDQQQVGNSVVLDFTGFPDDSFTIQFLGDVYNDSSNSQSSYRINRDITHVNNANLEINDFGAYHYVLSGNETFVFGNVEGDKIVNFKLYLTMPSTLVSFNWPLNIIWEEEPDVTSTNSLYMFTFEWNPILGKWLGNQFWPTIDMYSNSNSTSISNSSSIS